MQSIDCACVIHGNKYDWEYVERLYSMIKRNTTRDLKFHVFTEANRAVPPHMTKHALKEWTGISGPRKSWWYKMQLFDHRRLATQLLYLDLDVVIVDGIDWIFDNDPQHFWSIRDFRHLWKSSWTGMNSSIMFWDTVKFHWVWNEFCNQNIDKLVREYHGDQEYLSALLVDKHLRFFDSAKIKSWRWEIKDGGLNMRTREYHLPNAGSILTPNANILIFHGEPKPHEVTDPVIVEHWR